MLKIRIISGRFWDQRRRHFIRRQRWWWWWGHWSRSRCRFERNVRLFRTNEARTSRNKRSRRRGPRRLGQTFGRWLETSQESSRIVSKSRRGGGTHLNLTRTPRHQAEQRRKSLVLKNRTFSSWNRVINELCCFEDELSRAEMNEPNL